MLSVQKNIRNTHNLMTSFTACKQSGGAYAWLSCLIAKANKDRCNPSGCARYAGTEFEKDLTCSWVYMYQLLIDWLFVYCLTPCGQYPNNDCFGGYGKENDQSITTMTMTIMMTIMMKFLKQSFITAQ